MQIRHKRLNFSKHQKTATVMYGSCWHFGNPSVHEEGISRFIEAAKKMPFWHVGDIIESILPTDSRFSVLQHKQTSLENASIAADVLSKAKDTCWGLLVGNHEWKLAAQIGDISQKIAADAGVDYLSQTAYIHVKCPNGTATIFTAHGRGMINARTSEQERDQIGRCIRLRNLLRPFKASIKCIGHYHRTIIAPQVYKYMASSNGEKMQRRPESIRDEWCTACPSMFRNYSLDLIGSYAELALCEPTDLGWIQITFNRDGTIPCVQSIDENGKVSQEVYPTVLS